MSEIYIYKKNIWDLSGSRPTSAVIEVSVLRGVMLTQTLQDEFVVHESLDGFQQEGVEG